MVNTLDHRHLTSLFFNCLIDVNSGQTYRYDNIYITSDDAINHSQQLQLHMESPPEIVDLGDEEMDAKYDDSDSEADELPTHETEAIEYGIIEISTRTHKTDHKLKLTLHAKIVNDNFGLLTMMRKY